MPNKILSEIPRGRVTGRIGAWFAVAVLGAVTSVSAPAQTSSPELRQILARLDRLEEQNRELTAEVRALRSELASTRGRGNDGQTSVEERLAVQESRTAEQAETKVEAAHRFPIRVTGMALFNSYFNSQGSGGLEYPTIAVPGREGSGGATLRQSVIGLDYSGPRAFGGGKISGSLRMDFFGGSGQTLDQTVRLRTATIGIDWKDRSFLAGLDKPIISPREPESLAQVGISPLSGAGNLWIWLPQARFEQDFRFGDEAGVRAQFGVVQTAEVSGTQAAYRPPSAPPEYFAPARPGVEARVEFFHGTARRFEIASGIHHSVSHVGGSSVPSNVYSLDWFARPWHSLEFTGTAYTGQNVAPLGTGAIRQGFLVLRSGAAVPVHGQGGWAQLTYHLGPRLWLNFFSGQQDDRNSDLRYGSIGKNLAWGGNIFYRLAPNVLASFEASQTRTNYLGSGLLLNNHYDLAVAYLF